MECDGIERAAGITLGSFLTVKSGERYNLTFQQFINHNKCDLWFDDLGTSIEIVTK
jgi:hypothetical protein